MPCTTCDRYAGNTLTNICSEPAIAFDGNTTVRLTEPAASEPDCASGTALPSGATSTERATASDRVPPTALTVSVWRPTLSTRTGKRMPVTCPAPSGTSAVVAPSAVYQLPACSEM